MKKKMITIISSAAILVCAMPVQTVFAADATACNFTLTADKEYVHPDEEVTLTLSVNPNGDTLGFEFDFGTLPTGFTYVEDTLTILDSAKSTLGWSDFQIYEDDRIGFFVTDDTKVYGGGKINVATLKIKAGADSEAGSVVITPGEMIALDSKGDEATTTLTQPDLKIPGLEPVPEVPATCKTEGNSAYYKCEDCTLIYETNDRTRPTTPDAVKIAKTAHDFTATNTDPEYLSTEATCSAPAKYFKSCAVCGEKGTTTFEDPDGTLDPTKHGKINVDPTTVKAATCTESGYSGDGVCEDCGAEGAKGKVIPATGHKGGEATCVAKAICETCSEEYGDLNANNHKNTEIRDAKDATEEEEGYTGDTYCLDCESVTATGNTIPKLQPSNPAPTTPTPPSGVGTVTFPSSSDNSSTSDPANTSSSASTTSSDPGSSSNNTSSDTGVNTNVNKPSTNPSTGITVTVIPMVIAAGAAVIIAKNKKK